MTTRRSSYGTWPSPIDARSVARHVGAPSWPIALEDEVWWTEPRPSEDGRVTLCRVWLDAVGCPSEETLPAPWNARSRVIEYGGRPYTVFTGEDGPTVVFVEFGDQRLYRFNPGLARHPDEAVARPKAQPVALTPPPGAALDARYVEPILSPDRAEVWCVRETRTGPAPTDLARAIVAVPLDGSAASDPAVIRELVTGDRFLTCPRISPDGRRLAWIAWNHPDMPWDSTRLRVGSVAGGTVAAERTVAGGPGESVVQVEWADSETLYCSTDPEGWWNIHQITLPWDAEPTRPVVNLCRREEEFGGPLWKLGLTWFVPLRSGKIMTTHGRSTMALGRLSPDSGEIVDVDTPHTEWYGMLTVGGPADDYVVGVAASPEHPAEVVAVSTHDGTWRSLSRPAYPEERPDPLAPYLPRPRARVFTGEGGREVHANLYPPRNPEVSAPEDELPPYLVLAHGGPTGRAAMVHDLVIAYFTSRGIGVVEVNYGGSTGHGRAYRERLRERWGVVDVADSASVARALVAEGLADPDRLAIRGGSAGGWTSAVALTTTSVFACGTILYPILDLVGWRTGETHDFESRYLETLVGPWPAARERYEERSPTNRAGAITAPFLLLQGLDDAICPPTQCDRFLERVRRHGRAPHAYLAFEGEQHGFRRESTIVRTLEAELSLYAQVFGFDRPDVPVLELRATP